MAPKRSSSLFIHLFLLLLLCLTLVAALSHPLDPLSPSEISTAVKIINSSRPASSPSLSYHYIGLDEPDKPALHAHPPRRAFVIARAGRETREIYVDITSGRVVSDEVYRGLGFPLLNFEEQVDASALPFEYPLFLASLEARKLRQEDVLCTTFSVGWFGEKRQGRRLIKILCFATGETVNFYVRPIEGVTVVVDLDTMKIVEYEDTVRVPVPVAAGTDYRAAKQRPPFGPQTKPGVVVQPEGRGFEIDGHMIRLA